VEGVCLLALFSRRFEFKLPELKKGERSREEMEARLLKVKSRITLTPKVCVLEREKKGRVCG
jgi:hypothetical protein